MTSYLGNLVLVDSITQGVIDHYKKWEETYLAEVERLREYEPRDLPVTRSWITRNEFDSFPEEQLPSLVVVSPGIVQGSIEKYGGGEYQALWDVGVAIVSSARDREETDRLRASYGAAIRAIFIQHPDVGVGVVENWVDESYKDMPVDGERTVSVVQAIFQIRVEDLVEAYEGLREPLEDPYEEYNHPDIQDVQVDITKIG